MITTTITGLPYHGIKTVKESLVVGNRAFVRRDPENDYAPENGRKGVSEGCDGRAYAVYTKDVLIGYLPLLRSIRDYVREARAKGKMEKAETEIDRGLTVSVIRDALRVDEDFNGHDSWTVRVNEIKYKQAGKGEIAFSAYSLLPPEKQAAYEIAAVSIAFDDMGG